MSEPSAGDVHVPSPRWRFKKPQITPPRRRYKVRKDTTERGIPSLTNAAADKLAPPFKRKIAQTLDDFREQLAEQAKKLGASATVKQIEALGAFDDLISTLERVAMSSLHAANLTTGAAAAKASGLDFQFNLESPNARAWAEQNAADLVTAVTDVTRDGIKTIIENAYSGRDVTMTARDVRELLERDLSGLGGLTGRDANAVHSYRNQLEEQGAPDIDGKVGRLADRYRSARSENIARTEILRATNAGQSEFWQQIADAGLVDAATSRREWLLTEGSACPLCQELADMDENQDVGIDEQFTTPDGDQIDGPPLHPSCRCTTNLIIEKPDAAARDAIAATGPQGADVPLDAAVDEADAEVGKFLKALDASRPRTLYAHRPLLNVSDLHNWMRDQGISAPADDLHVTLMYSPTPFAWPEPEGGTITVPASPDRSVETMGDGEAIALVFQADYGAAPLHRRWREIRALGASSTYPTYRPHVTVTTESNFDPTGVAPYAGKLVFGPEVFREIEQD